MKNKDQNNIVHNGKEKFCFNFTKFLVKKNLKNFKIFFIKIFCASCSGFHCSGKYIKIMLCKGKGDLTENTKKKYK